ncbi:MAG: protein-signal peptide and transmembrane prediction [Planctomycetaceae bacterium]|nr:protein-signal peptide and transmembrane prediction [Planctomycetaceae bacterium]
MLKLHAQRRVETAVQGGRVEPIVEELNWQVSETAIIICDMWADHPCQLAAQRVGAMAPKMNRVVTEARAQGVAVIHAPSSGVKHYEQTPFRKRMKQAARAEPPVPIKGWCYLDPEKEDKLPIDDSDGGCDDPNPQPNPGFDRHEHPAIKIVGYDGISADGQEIYNFLEQEGIKNVVMMGVHANMCILGRPFGIRQLRYLGKDVVLVRDLTDAMYDPRDAPHVSHKRGTQLVVEHIERYWCPTILSRDLTSVVPGSDGPAK